MRNLLGTCSLLLLTAPVFAQSAATYAYPFVAADACPVTLSASRLGGEHLLEAQKPDAGTRPPAAIALRLSFLATSGEDRIVAATVTLHGMAGSALVPAGRPRAAESTERLHLHPERIQPSLFRSTVSPRELTGVEGVELNQITYADGHTWHESVPGTCVVQPNLFMRVDADTR